MLAMCGSLLRALYIEFDLNGFHGPEQLLSQSKMETIICELIDGEQTANPLDRTTTLRLKSFAAHLFCLALNWINRDSNWIFAIGDTLNISDIGLDSSRFYHLIMLLLF